MSDILDEALAAFDTHLGIEPDQAPAEASTTDGTPETETHEPTPVTPRDEQGRFAPKDGDAPGTPEDAAPPELILGRFKSHEELEKAYQQLDSEFGRRNEDWAELKTLKTELDEFRQSQQAQAERLEQQQFASQAPSLVEQHLDGGNYHAAAELARHAGNGALYQQVMNLWAADEPFNANNYHLFQMQQEQARQYQQMLDERLAPVQTLHEQSIANEKMKVLSAGFDEFAKDKPDIQQIAPAMLEVAQEAPHILAALTQNDPQATQQVLRYLYVEARERVSGTLAQAKDRVAQEQQQETTAAKQQAFVAAGTQRVEPETKSAEEAWLEQYFDPAASKYYPQGG